MPARVRSFTSLMSVRPSRTASRISAALTFSQRQTVTSSGTAYRSLRGENHASRKALDAVCTARERSRGALRRLNSSGPMPSCRSATARPASSPAIPATAAPRTRLQSPATYTPSRAVLPQPSQATVQHCWRASQWWGRSSAFAMCVRGMTPPWYSRVAASSVCAVPLEKKETRSRRSAPCASMPLTSRYTGVPLFRTSLSMDRPRSSRGRPSSPAGRCGAALSMLLGGV